MIETTSASPPFKSAVMPKSGSSCASSCAPMSGPNTSTVASQPSCCLLNVSKKAFHSSRGISRVGIFAPFLYIPVGNVSSGLAHHIPDRDRKSTRLNSSHDQISYAVFCLKKKKKKIKKHTYTNKEHET